MPRIRALIVKELREHWLAGLGLAFLLGVGLMAVLLGSVLRERTVTVLEAGTGYLLTFIPLAGVVLGHRLVVQEYHGRTQLFLEGLPVRRVEMVGVKFCLGLGVLVATAFAALAVIALVAALTEPIGARFAGILAGRTAGFVVWLWCFLFFMGFMGRFRIPIYLAILLAVSMVESLTEFEVMRFGPLALLDPQTFDTERERMPWGALGETLALAAALAGAAAAISLVREGSLAEQLARRMTQKEKAAVGILFVALLCAVGVLDQRRQKQPYEFGSEAVAAGERAPVEVLYHADPARPAAEALLARLEAEALALCDALGWDSVPSLRVALREDLDGDRFETAVMDENDGVLVRANFRAGADWDAAGFVAHATREWIAAHGSGRARFEPKRWLHDGFSRWWAERDAPRPVGPDSQAWLRGVWAARAAPPAAADIVAWHRFRERVGEKPAEGLAYTLVLELESAGGRAAVLALAREVFGRTPAPDVREAWYERANPLPAVFLRAAGLDWDAFLARWRAGIDRALADPRVAAALAAVPEGTAELHVEAGEGGLRSVGYRFAFSRAPAPGVLCALVHAPLGPFDAELAEPELRRREHPWPAGAAQAEWTLVGRYGAGQRAFLALEVDCPALGCPLRLAAERRDLP